MSDAKVFWIDKIELEAEKLKYRETEEMKVPDYLVKKKQDDNINKYFSSWLNPNIKPENYQVPQGE